MRSKRTLAGILSAAMLLTSNAFAISTEDFSDFPNNWSTEALTNAVENGLLQGTDGRINAEGLLTRAEMATIVNRAFKASKTTSLADFSDVSSNDWFYSEMAKAVEMGTFAGSNGKLSPKNAITREEAFTVLARAFEFENGNTSSLSQFTDSLDVSSWAKGPVSALIAEGYLSGANEKLNPKASITRAEFAQIMLNLVDTYITESGEFSKNTQGNLMVSAADTILKGITIDGDLIIADGVASGTVTLENVKVTGRIVIRGDANVIINGSSVSGKVIVSDNSSNVKVTVGNGSTIKNIDVNGKNTSISGTGVVNNVNANADDVSVTTPNTTVTVDNNASGVTAGGVSVGAGQTATTNNDGTGATIVTEKPGTSTGSSSSSGGNSSSSNIKTAGSWQELKAAALAATDGATIRLTSDITDAGSDTTVIDGVTSATLPIAKKNIIFDGNGKTISAANGKTFCFDIDGSAATVTGVTIKNLTVDGASFSAKLGGAFFVQDGAEVTFDGVTFKNCVAGSASNVTGGGAIFMNDHGAAGTTATVKNCTFENNKAGANAEGRGGAIYVDNFRSAAMKLTVKDSTFSGNTAAYGGAIAADGIADLTVTGCTFANNTASFADDIYIFDGVSEGKKSMTIASSVNAALTENTYSNATESAADMAQMNVIFGRYYDSTWTGTNGTTPADANDLTFVDIARTSILSASGKVEMTPYEILNKTYYYVLNQSGDAISGYTVNGADVTPQMLDGNIAFYASSASSDVIYGTTSMTYAELYYGELNSSAASDSVLNTALSNPSDALNVAGAYDAVTSATSQKGSHSAHYPSILNYIEGASDYATNPDSQFKIDGVKTVDVAVNADLYAQGIILNKAGNTCAIAKSASKITEITTSAPAEAKTLLTDGSYTAMQAISGGASKINYFAGATITPEVAYTSRYGDYQLTFRFTGGSLEADSYKNYLMNLYAATISDGTNKSGMLFYQDVWEETSHQYWIDICVSKGAVSAGGGFTPTRFDSFFTDDNTMHPGNYTITLKSRGYEDVTATFVVGTKLSDSEKITINDSIWNNGASTAVNTSALPAGFAADTYALKKGNVTLAEGIDYTYVSGSLTILNTTATGIGAYTFTLTDNDYQPAAASFVLNSTMTADQISFVDNMLTINNASGVSLSEYLDALSSIKIDGQTVSAPRGTALKDYLFNADGSVKFDAAKNGTSVFVDGSNGIYKIEVSATGYPSANGIVGNSNLDIWSAYNTGFESFITYLDDTALNAAWDAAASSDFAASAGISNATALKAMWRGMVSTTNTENTTPIAKMTFTDTTVTMLDAANAPIASYGYEICDKILEGLEGDVTYIIKTTDTTGTFAYIGLMAPGLDAEGLPAHFHFRYASSAAALDLENASNMWYPTMIDATATTEEKINLILALHGVGDIELPTSINAEATVEMFGYLAKVTVVFDSEGTIISVSDNGTEAGSNTSFWNNAVNMLPNFVGKKYADIDSIDGISGATLSSNAIKTAVKDALSD